MAKKYQKKEEKPIAKDKINKILFAIALGVSAAAIVLIYVGEPGKYGADPLLGIGIFSLALAGFTNLE